MDLDDEAHNQTGLKDNVYRARALSLCELQSPVMPGRASKSMRRRVHEFWGAFSSIVPRRTKADPTAMPIVEFSDKFCSRRIADPASRPCMFCLVSLPSFIREFARALLATHRPHRSRYSWEERAPRREQQVSRALQMVSGQPPFVPRVTTISSSLHYMRCMYLLNNI